MKKRILPLGSPERGSEPIKCADGEHVMLIAPTRLGKARDLIIPAALARTSSCLVIDFKGEICAVTRKQYEKSGQVPVLNPFNTLPKKRRRKFK